MSDATNVLALLIAQECKKTKNPLPLKYVTAERLVRAQGLSQPGHTAHFGNHVVHGHRHAGTDVLHDVDRASVIGNTEAAQFHVLSHLKRHGY